MTFKSLLYEVTLGHILCQTTTGLYSTQPTKASQTSEVFKTSEVSSNHKPELVAGVSHAILIFTSRGIPKLPELCS